MREAGNKVAGGMVLRKARHPRRDDGPAATAEERSESVQEMGDTGVPMRMSASTRGAGSDAGVVRIAADEGRVVPGGRAQKEVSRNRSGRYSDLPRLNLQEKTVSLHESAVNSPKATAEQTPNGSVSGTSATQTGYGINTRSKGTSSLVLIFYCGSRSFVDPELIM